MSFVHSDHFGWVCSVCAARCWLTDGVPTALSCQCPTGKATKRYGLEAGTKLNLGSGTHRHRPGYLNVDSNAELKPHFVATLPPLPFPDASCSALFASHFLEHLTKDDANTLIAEAWRVLEPGGVFEIVVPHAFSEDAIGDPTHRSLWVPRSFLYYTEKFRYLGYPVETRFTLTECRHVGDFNEVRATLKK